MSPLKILLILFLSQVLQSSEGYWIKVEATAYSPFDVIDSDYHLAHPSFNTADGTDWREDPYGIAADPKALPYGTKIYIPLGNGYLDGSLPNNRIFTVDDTGAKVRNNTRKTGQVFIDLRYKTPYSALRYGRKSFYVYVIR